MALGTGVGIIWHRQPGFGGGESCTASGSTVDDLGATSRLHVTVTLCEEPNFFPAESLDSGMTLTVNGDDTSWVLANGSADGNSITWDVETVGGNPNPISNGDVVVVDFDGSWTYPGEALQITLTNLIPAPVELLTLPAFDATTGRLDLGDFYNTRTTAETFVNSDGYVESVPANRMVYDGARIAYNAIASTSGCSSEDCTSSGWLAVTNSSFSGADELTISAASAVQAYVQATVAAVSGDVVALTVEMKAGTASNIWLTANNGLAWDTFSTQREINLTSDWVRYSLIGTMSGAGLIVRLIFGDKNKSGTVQTLDGTGTIKIRKAQIENLTAKSVQDAPGEYESVGVGIDGTEVVPDIAFTQWTDPTVPDGWAKEGTHNATNYVEENAGGLRFVSDGTYTGIKIAESLIASKSYVIQFGTIIGSGALILSGSSTLVTFSSVDSGKTYVVTADGTQLTLKRAGGAADVVISSISIEEATTGYGIYNRANDNTVNVNGVVTETPGDVLATAPVLRHAPAATNLIYPSTPNSTDWIFRGTVTGTNVEEGHALGPTCQIRGLGDIYVDDIYKIFTALSSGNRFEPSLHIKAVSTSGILKLWHPRGGAYGDWSIAMASLSTSAFEHITRDHASVTITTEFTTHPDNQVGLLLYTASGTLDFDILGCQTEEGTVSTPTIKTTTAPASRTIDQILHPNVLDQAQGSIVLRVKLKPGTYTPTADRGLVTIDTAVNNMLYLNSGDSISVESFDSTNTVNSGVVVQSADDELGIYLSYADSTEYPASGNISVGLKNLTTGSAWAESTGNYDGSYPNTGGLVRLLSGLTCEAEIADFVGYNVHQTPAVLKSFFLAEIPDGALVDTTTGDHLADTATADYLIETI